MTPLPYPHERVTRGWEPTPGPQFQDQMMGALMFKFLFDTDWDDSSKPLGRNSFYQLRCTFTLLPCRPEIVSYYQTRGECCEL